MLVYTGDGAMDISLARRTRWYLGWCSFKYVGEDVLAPFQLHITSRSKFNIDVAILFVSAFQVEQSSSKRLISSDIWSAERFPGLCDG